MSGVGEDEASFGALEVVVFEVGGEVEVGFCGDGVGEEVGTGTAAEGDATDATVGVVEGGAYCRLVRQLLHFQQERIGGHGLRELTDDAGADVGFVLPEDGAVLEAQFLGEDAADAPGEVVEVGVGGVDGDGVADEADDHTPGLGAVGEAFDAGEDEGVVGDDEVEPPGDALVDDLGGEVEGHECAAVGGGAFAEEEAGVVVIFLIFRVEGAVEEPYHVVDGCVAHNGL